MKVIIRRPRREVDAAVVPRRSLAGVRKRNGPPRPTLPAGSFSSTDSGPVPCFPTLQQVPRPPGRCACLLLCPGAYRPCRGLADALASGGRLALLLHAWFLVVPAHAHLAQHPRAFTLPLEAPDGLFQRFIAIDCYHRNPFSPGGGRVAPFVSYEPNSLVYRCTKLLSRKENSRI